MEISIYRAALLVALGGGAGSALRFLVWVWMRPSGGFPWATLAVNLAGCFLIGIIYGLSSRHASEQMRLLLATGFCGGFTTFSAFGAENLQLVQQGQFGLASAYAASSIAGGITAVWLGNLVLSKW